MVKFSVYEDGQREAERFKWIESEKAGYDLGEVAIRRWVREHWSGFLRSRWLEHLQGKNYWIELDQNDFGLLQRCFHDNASLLNQIIERLIAGYENLTIILWAVDHQLPMDDVIEILTALDINSRRLSHRFDS